MNTKRLQLSSLLVATTLAACGDKTAGGDGPLRCSPGTVINASGDRCLPARDGESPGADVIDSDADDTAVVPDSTDDTGADTAVPDVGEDVDESCVTGATRCSSGGVPQACISGSWTNAEPCPPGDVCLAGRCVDGIDCTPGDVRGCFDETRLSVCAPDGARYEPSPCAEGLFCFEGVCGTQRCDPGDLSCDEDGYTITQCDGTGENWIDFEVCDRRANRVCSGGECVSGCIAAAKDPSYVGCEYWTVDLPQYDDPTTAGPALPHAVVLANVGEYPASVSFETYSAATPPAPVTVAAGDSVAVQFPRLDLEGTEQTPNSFRIVTTEPIVAYQFNPFNNVNLFSNDASLLLPISALDRDYYVLGWPGGASIAFLGFPAQRAFFTVVAPSNGTTRVQITFSTAVVDGSTITGIRAGTTRAFTMTTGDVLNFSCESSLSTFTPCDFTGTRVTGDRPLLVFSGHEQAVIGEEGEGGSNCCADHLEEQLFPISTWGTRYLAVHSPPRGTEDDYWKVIASQDSTRIVTTPSIAGLDGITLNAGEFAEVNTPQSFEIEATAPIMVGQFLVSAQALGTVRSIGDPSFILAVPAEQFRTDYQMLVPDGYDEDYITVIRRVGAAVQLDGSAVSGPFTRIGGGEWEYAHVRVPPGPHRLTAAEDAPFGVLGYGYDNAVSYGYPGGLNLLGADSDTTPTP